MTQAHDENYQRALATAMAARAAIAWFTPGLRGAALSSMMSACAFVARAVGHEVARKPHEFIALLRRPIASWLPGGENEVLVEHNEPSGYCLDVTAEAGEDPAAEVAQAQVGECRATFALREDGEREYRAFRRFLCTKGHAKHFEAQKAIAASGVSLADLYESIPAECRLNIDGQPHLLACPRCTWPMQVHDDVIECAWSECRQSGSRFHRDGDRLTALGVRDVPSPTPVADRIRLRRGVWRYTLLPGIAELELASKLEAIPGAVVDLWPQRDRYDLHVTHGRHEWRIDVKDWSSPVSLARTLSRRASDDEMWIVVPDYHSDHVRVLAERCRGLRYRFASSKQFVAHVRAALGGDP